MDKNGVVAVVGGYSVTTQLRALTWLDAKANWKRMYPHASRSVPYMDNTGALINKSQPTMPCHNCGVVLPFEFLQVDHQKPQSDTDGLHILKMLRVLGGTTATPTGSKGLAFLGNTLDGSSRLCDVRLVLRHHAPTPS